MLEPLLEGGSEGHVASGCNRCGGHLQKRRRQFDRRQRRGRCRGWTIAADPINLGVIYLKRDGQVGQSGVAQHGIICEQQSVRVSVRAYRVTHDEVEQQ